MLSYIRSCGVFDVILSETDVVLLLFMCITLYVCEMHLTSVLCPWPTENYRADSLSSYPHSFTLSPPKGRKGGEGECDAACLGITPQASTAGDTSESSGESSEEGVWRCEGAMWCVRV